MKDLKNKQCTECTSCGTECKHEKTQGSREGNIKNEKLEHKQGQQENKYFGQIKSQDSREGNVKNEKPGHKHGHQQAKKVQPHEQHLQTESNRTRNGRESEEEQSRRSQDKKPQNLGKHDLKEINQSGHGSGRQEFGQQIHRKK